MRGAGPHGGPPERRRTSGGSSSAPRAIALLAVETARALGRGRDAGRAEPARLGARDARAAARTRRASSSRWPRSRRGRSTPSSSARLPLDDPEEAATAALQTGTAGRGRRRHRVPARAAARRRLRGDRRAAPARPAPALGAGAAGLRAGRRDPAPGRGRAPPAARRRRRGGGAAARARRGRRARASAALEQAVAYLEEALAIAPDARRAVARARRARGLARTPRARPRRRSAARSRCSRRPSRWSCARAWLRRARAYHGPICVPRVVLESARTALELLEPSRPAGQRGAKRGAGRMRLGRGGRRQRRGGGAAAGAAQRRALRERRLAHLRRRPRARARADAARALRRVLRPVDRRWRGGRASRPAGPRLRRAGSTPPARRPRPGSTSARSSSSIAATAAIAGHGLQSIEVHVLAARSFVLRRIGTARRTRAARRGRAGARGAARASRTLLAMASHDRGLVALEEGDCERAAELLAASLVDGAPISRPLTRLALAEALARGGHPERGGRAGARDRARAGPPERLPRRARAAARPRPGTDRARARELDEAERAARGVDRRLGAPARRGPSAPDSITTVLADLGRPVVGLVEPERELARARADLEAITRGEPNAVVP